MTKDEAYEKQRRERFFFIDISAVSERLDSLFQSDYRSLKR